MTPISETITGIILAGGAGTRINGVDKGLEAYNGTPLIKYVIERLEPQTSSLMISANRNIEEYEALGHPVINDNKPRAYDGPLAGTAACLTELLAMGSNSDYALLSSCDTPRLTAFLSERLYTALHNSNAVVAVAHDGKRRQNLHCMIKQSAWGNLISAYQGGARAMHRWQKSVGDIEVDFSDVSEAFTNLNHLADFAEKPTK